MKKLLKTTIAVSAVLVVVFLAVRFGRQQLGFAACESAGTEAVESGAYEAGIYVILERSDVYSIGWHFENKSGGITNADNTAIRSDEPLYLDNGIAQTAGNLERPVPFMLTFSDDTGNTIAQVNPVYDPAEPVLIVTVTADGGILVNGSEVEKAAVPVSYEVILTQYQTALTEGWGGQQLVDAGLNFMIRDVLPETVGYAVNDLDGDGIAELAIGTVSGDAFYGRLIFDLYTLEDNGNARLVFSSIERDRYYYAGGVRFANLGSSGAGDSFVTTLKLEDKEMVDMTFATDPADYVQMEFMTFAQWVK